MRYVILLVIAVISFVLLGTFISQHTGTIDINISGYGSIGLNLWVFALYLFLFIIAALVFFRILWWIISAPSKFKKYRKNKKEYKASSLLQKGMLAMGKGHWKKAESILVKGSKYSGSAKKDSSLFLSTAAVAAQNQGENSRRDKYLLQARKLKVEGVDTIASSLTEARMLLDQGKPEKALKLMSQFETSEHSSNFQVLNIQVQANSSLHNFGDAFDALVKAKKYFSKKEFTEQTIELSNSAFLDEDLELNIKSRIWNSLSKDLKSNDNLLLAYVSSLLQNSEQEKADKLITSVISKKLSPALIKSYSQIEVGSTIDKLKQVRKWLDSNPDNSPLNYAAAKFSLQSGEYEQAKDYAKKSLKGNPEHETFTLLGAIYEALGKKEAALHSYKAAISFNYINEDNSISGEVLPLKEEGPKIENLADK